jgi:hypothetical protein
MEGHPKEAAIQIAEHAVKCSQHLVGTANEKHYFYSDSDDLMDYMRNNSHHGVQIVSRSTRQPSAHLDELLVVERNFTWEAFANAFLDLYVAINAKCLTFGMGNFGYLAAQLSESNCTMRATIARKKKLLKWGTFHPNIPLCPIQF